MCVHSLSLSATGTLLKARPIHRSGVKDNIWDISRQEWNLNNDCENCLKASIHFVILTLIYGSNLRNF